MIAMLKEITNFRIETPDESLVVVKTILIY